MNTYDKETKDWKHIICYTLFEGGNEYNLVCTNPEFINLRHKAKETKGSKITIPIKDEKKEANWIEFEDGAQWDEVNGFIHYNKETAMENKIEKEYNSARAEDLYTSLECTQELTKEFIKIVLEDIKIFDKKQSDYGSKNIAEFGEYGVLVRVSDKFERLKNLTSERTTDKRAMSEKIADPNIMERINIANESIEDNWLDISNYGIIARMCRKRVWPL